MGGLGIRFGSKFLMEEVRQKGLDDTLQLMRNDTRTLGSLRRETGANGWNNRVKSEMSHNGRRICLRG